MELKRDDDSTQSHRALGWRLAGGGRANQITFENVRSGRRLAALLRGHDDIGSAVQATRATLGPSPRAGPAVSQSGTWRCAVSSRPISARPWSSKLLTALRAPWPAQRSAHDLLAIGRGVADIGRSAGSRIAHAALTELSKVLPRLGDAEALSAILAALCQLADAGPESRRPCHQSARAAIEPRRRRGFSAWVSAGLRASGGCAARRDGRTSGWMTRSRRAFFALGRTGDDFARLEKRLAATMVALWNRKPRFRKLAIPPTPVPRRTSLAAGLVGLPETFAGFEGERADQIYLAAVAHAGAHPRLLHRPLSGWPA